MTRILDNGCVRRTIGFGPLEQPEKFYRIGGNAPATDIARLSFLILPIADMAPSIAGRICRVPAMVMLSRLRTLITDRRNARASSCVSWR
ncbi:hypothetical protein [Sphingomonas colocasiae]|uniref:Uncharacterized protein n=1 Tax=Sphingomonas colocasiae TaxID=1848973 RepID=A0ABS7PWK6_9SPHN|nr:hypothetical protein [Sphingomonas colocasiae]MBY8825740.1 hypothetical protein [Sphingomonas colocasiae]